MKEREESAERILKRAEDIFTALGPLYSFEEFNKNNITIPQLRLLLLLKTRGTLKVGVIAEGLNVSMPTVTGIVDNLVKKGYVNREFDSGDRRSVLCELSEQGSAVMNQLWTMSREQIKQIIKGLTAEKLKKVEEVTEILLDNILINKEEKV